jgi:hypothetical protein
VGYVAKQKQGRKQFDALDENNQEKAIDAIRERREKVYVAPGPERKLRVRNLIDIHWKHVRDELQPPAYAVAYFRIMSCIIDHANSYTGVCCPGQTAIAIKTGYCVRTVKRVVKWWCERGLLKTESRGGRSLAYHPQWAELDAIGNAIAESIKVSIEDWRK